MNSEEFKRHWEAAAIPPDGWNGHQYFRTGSGHKIRYGHAPAIGETKGTVVLTHGYGEHIDIYFETIKKYQERGYEVFAMDWHGHGKSSRDDPAHPDRASSVGMHRHVDDLHEFMTRIVHPSRHKDSDKLIMSTNSMGGHIGLLYIKEHDDVFDAAVMSTPMFDIVRRGLPEFMRPVLKHLFNAASKIGLKNWQVPTGDTVTEKLMRLTEDMSDVKMTDLSGENIRSHIADLIRAFHPHAKLGEPTVGWIASVYNSVAPTMKKRYLQTIKTPILIGSAGQENLVENNAHKKAARYAQNAELFELPTATHGLWLETDENHSAWWDRIDTFLQKHAADKQPAPDTAPKETGPAANENVRDRSRNGLRPAA